MPLIYKLRLQKYILFITRKNFFTKKRKHVSLCHYFKKGHAILSSIPKGLGPYGKD